MVGDPGSMRQIPPGGGIVIGCAIALVMWAFVAGGAYAAWRLLR